MSTWRSGLTTWSGPAWCRQSSAAAGSSRPMHTSSMPKMSEGRTVVLGLGNPLMGDDGLGLAALERLREQWEIPGVELVDGGTWGMNLLPLVEESTHLILLDAIRSGDAPGTLVEWERDRLPRYLSLKLSPHQIDLREILALAEWRDTMPEEIVAVGLAPRDVVMTTSLSPEVDSGLDKVVEAALRYLAWWGYRAERKAAYAHA
ncbi:MAG: hydrogenase maturation protease [Gemmatimonadales bacterium]|nr:MAG: hydrogenase maturation protease [Gemmatimonadales bacterium]